MSERKYKIMFDDYFMLDDEMVFRIKALRDFADVKEGDLGGYISNAQNLSQEDTCWVYSDAIVSGMSHIRDHAVIYSTIPGTMCQVTDSVIGHWSRVTDSLVKNCTVLGTSYIEGSSVHDSKTQGKTVLVNTEEVAGTFFNKHIAKTKLASGMPA